MKDALAIAFPLAQLGVEFFFVISGFLITTLLLKEQAETKTISLRNFYIRRLFRIVPVAYLYLIIVLVASLALNLHPNYFYLGASLLFLRNFFQNSEGINNLGAHYWSLSVEEQFYLIFPVILKKWFAFYIFFLCFVIAISTLSDVVALFMNPSGEPGKLAFIFLRQFQSIAIGSLFSVYLFKSGLPQTQFIPHQSLVGIVLFIGILSLCFVRTAFPHFVALLQSAIFCVIVLLNLRANDSALFRILNNKYFKFVGVLSYSIYIWQQPLTLNLTFIDNVRFFKQYQNNLPVHLCISAASVILLCAISYLSYFFYERRFLSLKQRFSSMRQQ